MSKNKEIVFHTFDAFYQRDSKVLILGTIPSKKSRELGFYYMHPMNRFWKILSLVFNENIEDDIDSKKKFLIKHKIALWDVLASCEIIGSSDSSIKKEIPNDIEDLLNKTNIKKIYTTGKKAYNLYQKYCYSKTLIEAISLPSTSPANCAVKEIELVESYQQIKNDLDS